MRWPPSICRCTSCSSGWTAAAHRCQSGAARNQDSAAARRPCRSCFAPALTQISADTHEQWDVKVLWAIRRPCTRGSTTRVGLRRPGAAHRSCDVMFCVLCGGGSGALKQRLPAATSCRPCRRASRSARRASRWSPPAVGTLRSSVRKADSPCTGHQARYSAANCTT